MKKSIHLSLLLLLSLFVLLLSACGSDDKVNLVIYGPDGAVLSNSLVLPDTEGKAILTMNLNIKELTSVTVECDDPKNPWCQLSYGGEPHQVILDYSANQDMAQRMATLRFSYSGSSRVIILTQSPKRGIWEIESCYVIPREGGSISITFQKNTDCGVGQGLGSDAFSITGIIQTENSSTVTLDITPNKGFGRVMSLIIKPAGSTDVEIPLWQQPRELGSSEDIVLSEAGTLAVRMGCDFANIANISDLTIAGEINGADIAFLRDLCNRQFMGSHQGVSPALGNLKLNLLSATIVDGCDSKFASMGIGQPQQDQMVTTAKNVIPQRMLTGATRLEHISLPQTVTQICDHAFYYCPQLRYVRLPRDIEVIGNSAFQSCDKLTEVDFGDIFAEGSVLSTIEEYAFSDVGVLESFFFPASLVNLPKTGLNFKVKTLYVLWPTPPTIQNGPSTEECILYVPAGCADAYRSAPYWSEFTTIIEL